MREIHLFEYKYKRLNNTLTTCRLVSSRKKIPSFPLVFVIYLKLLFLKFDYSQKKIMYCFQCIGTCGK